MSKKQQLSVIQPVYEIGTTVFSTTTLDRAVIFQRVYTEQVDQEALWQYRLQLGEQDGQPLVTKDLFTSNQLCLKDVAEEILKNKEAELHD